MLEFKVILGAVVGHVYVGILLASLTLLTYRPTNAASLFVWGCSMPLTIFSYLVWIYGGGGDHWTLQMLVIQLLALAQIGWLGGLLALSGLISQWRTLKRAGSAISIASVALHGVFLGGVVFGSDSS